MKDLILSHVYETASWVEGAVEFGVGLDLSKEPFRKDAMAKAVFFNKKTLLHTYIEEEFVSHYEHWFCRMPEEAVNSIISLDFLEDKFSHYGVAIDFLQIKMDEEGNILTPESRATRWYRKNKKKFAALAKAVSGEIFHVLFYNKSLLQKFNVVLAKRFTEFRFDSASLTPQGKLKRKNIPMWLQKSVFHRDKGRCSFCCIDLTGVYNINSPHNYDHIVPLSLFGVNDPTNIQLLCERCNSEKRNRNTAVGTKYLDWFG